MIYTLICDGDALPAEALSAQVEACFLKRGIAPSMRICNSGAELLELLPTFGPDLIFLDLSLRDGDGYRLAEEIRARHLQTEIVFVTNHPDRMPEAFSYRPIGFITKPATAGDIEGVVSRFLNYYWSAEVRYFVNTRENSQQLLLRDILYFESSAHKVYIHLKSQQEPLCQLRKLDEIEEELRDHAFVRIHKSFLVRLEAVSNIDRSNLRVTMEGGANLPVSRRYYAQALEQFIRYQLRG